MINPEIKAYIENTILPKYDAFDAGHQQDHALHVISESLELAAKLHKNVEMAYVIAAFHDLGLVGPRETHHLLSGEIIANDTTLPRWFTTEQIQTMREAVEDHRASAKRPPRSIYGCIVSEADRDLSPETVIRRTIQYGLAHYPELTYEEQFQRMLDHLENKYSEHGYIKLWIPGSSNEQKIKTLHALIRQPEQLQKKFDQLFEEITGQTSHR